MVDVLKHYFQRVTGWDLYDPAGVGWETVDFLKADPKTLFDWIITNPPFSMAPEFALNARKHSRKGVAMLCRLAFLESGDRYRRIFQKAPPSNILVFSERVKMVEGRYDPKAESATCYAWFIWHHAYIYPTSVHWVPPTSRARLESLNQEQLF